MECGGWRPILALPIEISGLVQSHSQLSRNRSHDRATSYVKYLPHEGSCAQRSRPWSSSSPVRSEGSKCLRHVRILINRHVKSMPTFKKLKPSLAAYLTSSGRVRWDQSREGYIGGTCMALCNVPMKIFVECWLAWYGRPFTVEWIEDYVFSSGSWLA